MDLTTFKDIAATNQWSAIYPELTLGLLALGLLVLEVILPKTRHGLIPRIAILGQAILFVIVLTTGFKSPTLGTETFGGLLAHSSIGQVYRLFFLGASCLVCYLGLISLERRTLPRIEFFHIVLVITAAMMLLAQSNDFVMLFVSLETITVGFYVLVSYFKNSAASLEAGLKYIVLGALSSALLLFGIVLLYGVAGNPTLEGYALHPMYFPALRHFLDIHPTNHLAIVGMLLVLSGVAFKIGAVPFQVWIPDVYQGAPTPVTAFLAVASKAAGFAILLILVQKVFAPLHAVLVPVLVVVTILTILMGNLAALTQRNVKRLMGLSGVSHAGFLLLGVVASLQVKWASGAVVFYLITYLLGSMAVFSVMTLLGSADDSDLDVADFSNLAKEHPFLAGVLAIGLGSLAGIPPLAGFIGKLLVFIAAYQAGFIPLLFVAIVGVVLSIYYYFGWIKSAYFDTWTPPAGTEAPSARRTTVPVLTAAGKLTLVALAVLTVVLGFYQGPFGTWLTMH